MKFLKNLKIGTVMDSYLVFDVPKFQVSITINVGVVNFKSYILNSKDQH